MALVTATSLAYTGCRRDNELAALVTIVGVSGRGTEVDQRAPPQQHHEGELKGGPRVDVYRIAVIAAEGERIIDQTGTREGEYIAASVVDPIANPIYGITVPMLGRLTLDAQPG